MLQFFLIRILKDLLPYRYICLFPTLTSQTNPYKSMLNKRKTYSKEER